MRRYSVAEGVLHLIFSPSEHPDLPSRVGAGDCVVLMLGCSNALSGWDWPSDVRVFALAESPESLSSEDAIGYRELVALTLSFSRIVSW